MWAKVPQCFQLLFLDAQIWFWRKHFDRAYHNLLCAKLIKRNVPTCMCIVIVRLLLSWHREQTMQVKWAPAMVGSTDCAKYGCEPSCNVCWWHIVFNLLQPLFCWRCVECVIHHKWNVREEQHPHVCGANKHYNRMISSGKLYCCLLPQCEALRTCRSGFPIAAKWCCN